MENSHTRPLYFYLPLLPVLLMPWALLPSFWTGLRSLKEGFKTNTGLRFILCWVVPVIISFSFIGGKQPHYLVPLLPGVVILVAFLIRIKTQNLMKISAAVVFVFMAGQVMAAQSIFRNYDIQPIADYVYENQDKDWAFVRKYQGELTFLGRLDKAMDNEQMGTLQKWFKEHPDGMAVIRYKRPEDVSGFKMVMTQPYRGKNMGIFSGLAESGQ